MLEINNIVKQYANHIALNNVSLKVEKGVIFGLLGPNGAGKTSLIRIINQITAPDSGTIYFNGEKLSAQHIAKIGYLPEERGLYKKMKIGEQMLYLAQLKGLSKKDAVEKIKLWFEKMEIQAWWEKKIEDLSKGMQQKVQFIATVVHEPELIILDEPFSGFDPVNADLIKNEILELNKRGATIIFSTHRMESVEELCDSIALINKSQKILDGKVKAIKNQFAENRYLVTYEKNNNFLAMENEFFTVDDQVVSDGDMQTIKIRINENKTLNDALNHILPQIQIKEVKELIPTINDIFIKKVTQIA